MDNRTSTRQRRVLNYHTLNGGSDEEAAPEDMLLDDEAEDCESALKILN